MGKEEAADLATAAESMNKKSLLERYDIPIEHLSYEYIDRSTRVKELERIVLVLRSGEEGIYEDLTKRAEERLAAIKPESIVLRIAEAVVARDALAPERREKLENDMNEWTKEMKLREKDLEEGRTMRTKEPIPQPDIREISFEEHRKQRSSLNEKKIKRVSACDYAGWDRYDADTEFNRIELRYEKKQARIERAQRQLREKEGKIKEASREATVEKHIFTGTEFKVMAEEERKKGNEAFKAGDYEEALQFYNFSISIDATTEAYNNRAIACIKLRRYNDAVNDCNRVIGTEHTNIKALLRRGLAFEHLEQRAQALVDYEAVLKAEPTNKVAITAIKKLRAPCNSKKIKVKIEEESAAEENSVAKMSEVSKMNNLRLAESTIHRKEFKEIFRFVDETGRKTLNKHTILPRRASSELTPQPLYSQACCRNNASSSSRCASPLPHTRNIYCSETFEKFTEFPKFQSIFTNTKILSEKSSGLIIEEIPNEKEPYEKEMESSGAERSDDEPTSRRNV